MYHFNRQIANDRLIQILYGDFAVSWPSNISNEYSRLRKTIARAYLESNEV